MGFCNVHAVAPRDVVPVSGIRIAALPVRHAERLPSLLYKPGVGYLVSSAGEPGVYISGDTVLCDDLVEALRACEIQAAILYGGGARIPILGRHTFSHREILTLAELLPSSTIVVVHLDCLNHCPETGDRLAATIEKAGLGQRVLLPIPGEQYQL
jgi:L-ascorbate metabolism protein UlaG (beta-lactamase superfamily)